MKLGYFDCFAGASGDMILASLLDAGLSESSLIQGLAKLAIGDIDVTVGEIMRKDVRAKIFSFTHRVKPEPRNLKSIVGQIEASDLSPWVKAKSVEAFDTLAGAESRVHGIPKQEVHFHEVGSVDAIVDIVGSFIGLEALGIAKVVSSPLALGSGHLECAHGTLPVPAPATLEIVQGLPVRGWRLHGELTTPTGAAILRTCASEFGSVPNMTVTAVGYGAGSRDLDEIPNVLRFIIGEASDCRFDRVMLLETNIDDMNPQFFSHIFEDLYSQGALDVWVANVLMKKGRPGYVLSVLTEPGCVGQISECILSGTTTSGVRMREVDRIKLARESVEVDTKYGRVRIKVFTLDSKTRWAPEYEDCLRLARAAGIPIEQVIEEARDAFRQSSERSS